MNTFAPHQTLLPYARVTNGLFFYDSNQGQQTLLLVHGNGDEADTWRHIFVPLAKHYRVIALDLPGFGRSLTQTSSVAGFTKTILGLISTLKLEPLHLIGSSLGAVVAATFAAQHPTLVSSLCLMGGAAPNLGGLSATTAIQPLLTVGVGEAYYTGLRQTSPETAFETLRPYYADLNRLPSHDLEFLKTRVWERVQSDTQREAFFAALRSLFAPAATLILSTPTHLIWGDTDNIVPHLHAEQILRQIPNSRLSIIAQAGHLPHQEQPQATLAAFFSSNE